MLPYRPLPIPKWLSVTRCPRFVHHSLSTFRRSRWSQPRRAGRKPWSPRYRCCYSRSRSTRGYTSAGAAAVQPPGPYVSPAPQISRSSSRVKMGSLWMVAKVYPRIIIDSSTEFCTNTSLRAIIIIIIKSWYVLFSPFCFSKIDFILHRWKVWGCHLMPFKYLTNCRKQSQFVVVLNVCWVPLS